MTSPRDYQMLQQGIQAWQPYASRVQNSRLLEQAAGAMNQPTATGQMTVPASVGGGGQTMGSNMRPTGPQGLTTEKIMQIAKGSNNPWGMVQNLGLLKQMKAKEVIAEAGKDIMQKYREKGGRLTQEDLADTGERFGLGAEGMARLIKMLRSSGAIAPEPEQYTLSPGEVRYSGPRPMAVNPDRGNTPDIGETRSFKKGSRIVYQEYTKDGWRNLSSAPRKISADNMTETKARKRISQIQKAKAKLEQGEGALQAFLKSNPGLAQSSEDPAMQSAIQSILGGKSISPETKEALYEAWEDEEKYLRQEYVKTELNPEDPLGLFE